MRQVRVLTAHFLLLTALAVLPSHAQDAATADVRLVVDISGSMKQNDPNNLRQPAVELLVKLLPDDSKAGVWTFGQYVNMLVPHRVVDDAWAADAAGKASDINSVGLFTNIGAALDKATYDRGRDPDNYNTSVILLTDGMVDIDKSPQANQREWRRIVDEVVPALASAGVRVHTIALSDKADSALLNKIALATGGKAAVAKSADELMTAFLAAFDQAAPAEQVPLEGDRFAVDSSVEEFTALIFRSNKVTPSVLVGPDLTRYSQASAASDPEIDWYAGIDYDLITLKQPLEGEWVVETGIAPDSRVTVVSNLNLVVKTMPTNLFRGQQLPLDIRLQQDGLTVTNGDFLQLLDLSVETLWGEERWNDSLSSGVIPADGVYRARIPHFNEVGDYQLSIKLDGKSFQRQHKHTVTVRDAFDVKFGPGAHEGMPHELRVTPFVQTLDLSASHVIARITNPSGQTSLLPVPLTQVDDWLLKYSMRDEGVYEISLAIDVVETNGNAYEYQHPTIRYSFPDGAIAATEPEPVPAAAAEPAPTPKAAPEPEPEQDSGTPWWVYVALGVGNLLIFGLAFAAYKILMGGKSEEQDSESKPEKKSKKSKKKAAKEEPEPDTEDDDDDDEEPAPPPPREALAMADIADDDLDDEDESDLDVTIGAEPDDTAMDISTDAVVNDLDDDNDDSGGELPDAPMDDLDAMLAEATSDFEADDDDEEFKLDDFDSSSGKT